MYKEENMTEFYGYGEKKICLVTGGGRGIGASITQRLAKLGYRVVINYFNSEIQSVHLAKGLIHSGFEALTIQADVSNKNQVDAMFARIEDTWGAVDCLINNAGVSLHKMLVDSGEEEWRHIMDTNLKSVYLCSKRAMPAMMAKRWGRVVNIASVWGITGASCESIYAASKGGMIAFSKSLASEYGAYGITVNTIAPGIVETDMIRNSLSRRELQDLVDEIPAARLGKTDDVAAACGYFLSSGAEFVNGQVLSIDGGWKIT